MGVTNEQFLFSCIDNSNSGTINFQDVADACGITTKGAAYIKFRRMKEKLGTIPNGGEETTGAGDATASGKSEKMTTKKVVKKSTSKKRKVEASEDVDDVDDGVKAIKEEVTEE
ncbi:hypothetical protein B0A50_07659 [Salinomyces thailandicus]|uniref:Myb-like DNA-binding domain-containing protein n=1 Tax=Salinomyces thailandicus TaxID=706561 RepID=A0A4U0TL68_9PEZI|nr:hypothetical protein B0A50_07659 [Salinomyces thailandica]